jgi:hypothetical protein
MRVHLNIPDLLLSQIDQLAERDHVDRTATVCRLLARGAADELADWAARDGADRGPSVASAVQAHGVGATGQPLDGSALVHPFPVEWLARQLPPGARPTFGPLGGAGELEQADAGKAVELAAQAQLLRKRAENGLDSTGLALEQAATRAAVQGTGPRPMGDLPAMAKAGRLKPGKAPAVTDG